MKCLSYDYYSENDIKFAEVMPYFSLCDRYPEQMKDLNIKKHKVYIPDNDFKWSHCASVIKYHGVLYASWVNCPLYENQGFMPTRGARSYDDGKTWTAPEIFAADETGAMRVYPAVFGVSENKLYMFVSEENAPDSIHSLMLYCLNNATQKFEYVRTLSLPFMPNSNVYTLPNGKLMITGRAGEIDGVPRCPAVIISDEGKIDSQWRLVKVCDDYHLTNDKDLDYPETACFINNDLIYMLCRVDSSRVQVLYLSDDYGEHWSSAYAHDLPYVNSNMYAGNLADGRKYIICNIPYSGRYDRSKLVIYFAGANSDKFNEYAVIEDAEINREDAQYPAAFEADGKLYVIATRQYWEEGRIGPDVANGYVGTRGIDLFVIDLKD